MPKSNRSERTLDCSFEVETSPVDKVIESRIAEEELHTAEDRLDWVELGRVGHVQDRLDVKSFHLFHRSSAFVH